MMKRCLTYLAAVLMALPSLSLAGTNMPRAPRDIAQIALLPGWRTDAGVHMAALHIRLADGWKTYWRAPGDGGIPPSLDLRRSKNIRSVQFHWPVPDVFVENGVRTIGYKHELVLPMTITPKRPDAPIALNGVLQIGVCLDICMPMRAELASTLPQTAVAVDRKIEDALQQRPDTAAEAGVVRATCRMVPVAEGLGMEAEITMPRVGAKEVVVVETADPEVWVAEAEQRREGGRLLVRTEMVPPNAQPFVVNRADIRFTVLADGRGVDIQGCTGG